MQVEKQIAPRFEKYILDWDYETYLAVGGYGSSKSYNTAFKLVLKLFQEKRKALVIREVFETIKESCFDLLCEILDDMSMLAGDNIRSKSKCIAVLSPMQIKFPNGSRIIFKGMDKPRKLKSINGVSIVWLEECSEIKYEGYKEMLGRLRTPDVTTHFLLTTNPTTLDNWVYTHFFKRTDDQGSEMVILDDERLYKMQTLVKNGVYYHHSTPSDNPFLPAAYIKRLEELKNYDWDLYRVAVLGKFGITGTVVLPQFEIAKSHSEVIQKVREIPEKFRFVGMDFGFEESYNALIKCACDDKEKILYIYKEYYKNQMTDIETAAELKQLGLDKTLITADCAEPKAIRLYNNLGFKMRPCHKVGNSRLDNTKKIKRFKKIICSPQCINAIRELRGLTYYKDSKGTVQYDQFNIDPHTFSAIWYALNNYEVVDIKKIERNTRGGR